MSRSPSICGVVLSAGFSTRMGRDKALLPWPPAAQNHSYRDSFLGATIARLKHVCEIVLVVGGANAEGIAPVVYSSSATLVVNTEPERGQFSSLRLGLRAVLNQGRDAAFVALVDRPPATPDTYQALRKAFLAALNDEYWAVVPEFEGQHGHPFVVGREFIELFLRAPEESNARDVMHANQQRIHYVAVNDPMVIANINTPEDYERLRTSASI